MGKRRHDGVVRIETAARDALVAYCRENGLIAGFMLSKLVRDFLAGVGRPVIDTEGVSHGGKTGPGRTGRGGKKAGA
jgi:hypothetical protein